VTFTHLDMDEAECEMAGGGIVAYIILPKGFASDFENGVNTPPVVKTAGGLKSELVKLFVNCAIGELSASQAGIYATLDYVAKTGDKALYSKAFQDINLSFISLFLSREAMVKAVTISAAGAVSPGIFLIVNFFVFFCVINTGFISGCFCGTGRGPRLRGAGVPVPLIMISHLFSGMLLNTLLAAAVAAALLVSGLFQGTVIHMDAARAPILFAVVLSLSAFSVFWHALTADRRAGGIAVFSFALLSLVLSGGLIPSSFLPGKLASASIFTYNYYVSGVLTGFFTRNPAVPVSGLLAYTAAALLSGYFLLRKR